MIRTPDQRIRVFVSSTLRELADERRAARAAIERMRLAPVMFELGARPHPPRELYRSYLEQSDVFVGIYGERYGWIAPGEEVSGLEDEYLLAPATMPKLIYIKEAENREDRLNNLIDRIRGDDTASYVSFATAEELAERVAGDLATMLAERFEGSRAPEEADAVSPLATKIPPPYTETLGRDADVAAVLDLLADDTVRLVTLVGPGGIGKSRLAIEVALRAAAVGDRDVAFILLEHVTDPGQVIPTIAAEFGVRDSGRGSIADDIGRALGDRRMLVVLDNFEQVLDAAPVLVALSEALPGTSFLVTSRARLRVRPEHVYDVPPLPLPDPTRAIHAGTALDSWAIRLFRDRARAANPAFDITEDNVAAVAGICAALDGVPLALELAAARIRVLTPSALLERLERRLPLLVASTRDLPDRQRTIETTIAWSAGLLEPAPRALLIRLGVFAGDFSLDAVEAVGAGLSADADTLSLLTELVDNSLVRPRELAAVPVFGLLATVREYALALLEASPDAAEVRRLHADHYTRLALEIAPKLQGRTQLSALARLGAERDNLRTAGRHLLEMGAVDMLSRVVWDLFLYWWIRGLMPEARAWMDAILATGVAVSDATRAIALGYSSWVSLWQQRGGVGPGPFEESVALFRSIGDRDSEALALGSLALAYLAEVPPELDRAEESGRASLSMLEGRMPTIESMAKVAIGRVFVVRGDVAQAARWFDEALEQAELIGDPFATTLAITNRAWMWIAQGAPRGDLFERNLVLATELGNVDGAAYALEGLIAISVLSGDIERAGVIAGAAESVRRLTGMGEQATIVTFEPFVASVLATAAAPAFEAARARGRMMTVHEATEYALGSAAGPTADTGATLETSSGARS
ncbi:ATP-binding protein [Microbacterium deminutum]|uniref:BTAD domain-containing putative transcriptional regulator n=1 Tax=Microbacterium deminutum TaxID=344164 RepID=A0ABP5BIW4_9MICO